MYSLLYHYCSVITHKYWVAHYLFKIIFQLVGRAIVHDFSKFSWIETKGFSSVVRKLRNTSYHTPEYKDNLNKIRPAIDHHRKNNSHHPEFYTNEIDGMSALDLLEMICDWKAASKRHKDGDVWKSLDINQERFGYSDDVKKVLERIMVDIGCERKEIPEQNETRAMKLGRQAAQTRDDIMIKVAHRANEEK